MTSKFRVPTVISRFLDYSTPSLIKYLRSSILSYLLVFFNKIKIWSFLDEFLLSTLLSSPCPFFGMLMCFVTSFVNFSKKKLSILFWMIRKANIKYDTVVNSARAHLTQQKVIHILWAVVAPILVGSCSLTISCQGTFTQHTISQPLDHDPTAGTKGKFFRYPR